MGLLNQKTESGGSNSPATTEQTVATYGYDASNGEAVLFQLKLGEKLPSGFVDSPSKVKPSKGK